MYHFQEYTRHRLVPTQFSCAVSPSLGQVQTNRNHNVNAKPSITSCFSVQYVTYQDVYLHIEVKAKGIKGKKKGSSEEKHELVSYQSFTTHVFFSPQN